MEQFRIELADNQGSVQFFDIRMLDSNHFQIFNAQLERMATIEIDAQDRNHYRQSLDCRLELPLLNAIKDRIMSQGQLT